MCLPSLSLPIGAHPTGSSDPPPLFVCHPTSARLRRAGLLPATRTPPSMLLHLAPTPTQLDPLPPLPQCAKPGPRSFSFLLHASALEPQSKELHHRSTQSQPPNRPSLPRSHSTVLLVRFANHSRRRAHQGRSIRRSRRLLRPSPSAAVPSEPPSSSPYQAGSPSSTRACATAPAASCRLSHRRSSRHHTRARCGDQPGARPPHKWNGPRRPLRPQARPNRPARPFRELGRTLATTRDPVWLTDAVWPCAYSPRCCAI
jgi:hypothetical protein